MTCYSGFGKLTDGKHPVWVGDFNGDGRAEILFYYTGDQNWWLGQFGADGRLSWSLAGNTAGFGQVWDGRPIWIGNFSGDGKTDILFYYPGDNNWWLGQFGADNRLSWNLAGNTAGFGQVWDGRPFWTGDFTGDNRTDILFYYPGDSNWWLGRFDSNNRLNWNLAGNTAGFGQVGDGRPIWAGDFTGDGRADVLFYFPGDNNWWLGQFGSNNQLNWGLVGNTAGFGQVGDGRPFWNARFSRSDRNQI